MRFIMKLCILSCSSHGILAKLFPKELALSQDNGLGLF